MPVRRVRNPFRKPPIREKRALTDEERRLGRWMLEHGEPDARAFLPQLDRARVVSRCPCGCATIELEVDGFAPVKDAGLEVLGDFWCQDGDDTNGIFIYRYGDVLGGIEVYGLSGDAPKALPAPGMLHPMEAVFGDPE